MDDFLQTRYREITFSAVVFGVLVGAVMNAAITYAGLKIGFTLGGSAIAAVLGFGVLRGLLRRGTILETNIGQTVASAVNTSNSGVIFTVPVLLLTGHDMAAGGADFWLITLACSAGAVLGAALIIPLRKQMIDIERLRFPTGTAVASILKSPGAGPAKAVVLLAGIAVGMAIFFPTQLGLLKIAALGGHGLSHLPVVGVEADPAHGFVDDESVDVGKLIGLPAEMQLVFAIAPFALGAGYLTGRAGLYVLAGGLLAFFVINPLAFRMEWMPATVSADAAAQYGYGAYNRPLGIGLLLGGALMGVLASLPAIVQAFRSVGAARRHKSPGRAGDILRAEVEETRGRRAAGSKERHAGQDELGIRVLGAAIIAAVVLLYLAADLVGNRPINDHCPVTGEAVTSVATTVEYQGYRLALSSDAAADQWRQWDDARRTALLTSLGARPGWLARLDSHLRAAVIAVVGSLWIWFAGVIIAQCTGMTDWSPISGMALLTVVLVLMLAGSGAVVGAVLIGAALCVAITLAADMMQDLKTGFLVGAQPKRQQTIELLAVGIGPVISMVTLMLIVATNRQETGIPLGPGTATVAPQAQALQAVIVGVQGGELPYALYAIGAVMGMALGAGAFSGLGVLIGLSMYLPFHYIATYGIGCLANMCVARIRGRTWAEEWGVPFCAGLIVGESTLALVINMFILMRGGGG